MCAVVGAGVLPLADASETPAGARTGIERLLDKRSRALLAGDKRAFMATVAPGSQAFVRDQARLFASVSQVPLQSYRLRAVWGRYGDLVRASDRARYPGAQRVAIPVTEERYRIRGFDGRAVEEDLFYTFVQQGGRWRIASDSDLNDLGLGSARQLWDFGPVTVSRSPYFMLLAHPCSAPIGCARLPGDVLGVAETALERVDRFWHVPWQHRIVISAPTTTAELRRILQAPFDVNKFVAFAVSSEDIEHGLRFIGHRIIVNWRTLANRSRGSVLTILAHELTHVATRSSSGPQIPTFVEEGIAEYVGYNADPSSLSYLNSVVGVDGFDGKLPRDYQFTTGSATDIFLSYQKAESAVGYFIHRWGLDRFVRFYQALGRQRVVIGMPRWHLDHALRQTIGIGFARFQKQWASSLRR